MRGFFILFINGQMIELFALLKLAQILIILTIGAQCWIIIYLVLRDR